MGDSSQAGASANATATYSGGTDDYRVDNTVTTGEFSPGDSATDFGKANPPAATTSASPSNPTQTNYGGMALTAAGGITTAYAAYSSGKYNKRVSDFNAKLAKQQAEQAVQAGEFAAGQRHARGLVTQGQARGAQAVSGTVVGAGTNASALASNEAVTAMDEQTIRSNALREAFGYKVRAMSDKEAGRMEEQKAKMAVLSTGLNAMSEELLQSDPNFNGFRGRGVQF